MWINTWNISSNASWQKHITMYVSDWPLLILSMPIPFDFVDPVLSIVYINLFIFFCSLSACFPDFSNNDGEISSLVFNKLVWNSSSLQNLSSALKTVKYDRFFFLKFVKYFKCRNYQTYFSTQFLGCNSATNE